jgi:hypothetical protein
MFLNIAPHLAAYEKSAQKESMSLSGRLMYERFVHQFSGALDYSRVQNKPLRSVTVVLLDKDKHIIKKSATDHQGYYQFLVQPNTTYFVQIKAELNSTLITNLSSSFFLLNETEAHLLKARYHFSVETPRNEIYSVISSPQNISQHSKMYNYTISSGWDNRIQKYNQKRESAPFAIIDTIFTATKFYLDVDPTLNMPSLQIIWSPKMLGTHYYALNKKIIIQSSVYLFLGIYLMPMNMMSMSFLTNGIVILQCIFIVLMKNKLNYGGFQGDGIKLWRLLF